MPKGVPNKRYTPEFKKLVIETGTYYDEYGNEISEEALTRRLEDKNDNVVCEYIDRNENVVSLRYTPKDGTILPITVCTEDDLQEARQTAAVRHVIFGAVYCIECLAVVGSVKIYAQNCLQAPAE